MTDVDGTHTDTGDVELSKGFDAHGVPAAVRVPVEDPNQLPWWRRRRRQLIEYLVRRVHTAGALDAAAYLVVNGMPHPRWLNTAMRVVSRTMLHAEIWVVVLLAGVLVDPVEGWAILVAVLPPLWVATLLVNYGVKRIFERDRPFIALVDAVVVGKRPGDHSFPSGHTAGAFAGAYLLAAHYPHAVGPMFAFAALVGFTRVYLGVHYPGDVLVGAGVGIGLAAVCRWLWAAAVLLF